MCPLEPDKREAPSNLPFLGFPPTCLSASAYLAPGLLPPCAFQLPPTRRLAPHSPGSRSVTWDIIILTGHLDPVKGGVSFGAVRKARWINRGPSFSRLSSCATGADLSTLKAGRLARSAASCLCSGRLDHRRSYRQGVSRASSWIRHRTGWLWRSAPLPVIRHRGSCRHC